MLPFRCRLSVRYCFCVFRSRFRLVPLESVIISQNEIHKYNLYVQNLYLSSLSVVCMVSIRYRVSFNIFPENLHTRTVKSNRRS
ncbi:hypothetical protein Hanom_Chr04g00369981 [Helianthus anomalus]